MKKAILACTCAVLLSTGGAFAQMQPAPGASSEGNVGPGATKTHKTTAHKKGTTTGTGSGKMMKSGGTSSAPSGSGSGGAGAMSK